MHSDFTYFTESIASSLIIMHLSNFASMTKASTALMLEFLGDSKRYNDLIRHETLRVAVCDALEGSPVMPQKLKYVYRKNQLDFK